MLSGFKEAVQSSEPDNVDASTGHNNSLKHLTCSDLDLDLKFGCDPSSRSGDMGSKIIYLVVTLTLTHRPLKPNQFTCRLNYTINQSLQNSVC